MAALRTDYGELWVHLVGAAYYVLQAVLQSLALVHPRPARTAWTVAAAALRIAYPVLAALFFVVRATGPLSRGRRVATHTLLAAMTLVLAARTAIELAAGDDLVPGSRSTSVFLHGMWLAKGARMGPAPDSVNAAQMPHYVAM